MPKNPTINNDADPNDERSREKDVREWWTQATAGLAAEKATQAENFRFYCGGDGQWDAQDLVDLDEDGKPHLSYNKCKPAIDMLSGHQRRFRDSLQVLPRRNASSQNARVITEMGRHAMDVSRPGGDYVLSEQFLMGCIGGEWWTGIDLDYQFDILNGDIKPRAISSFEILSDPFYRGYDVNNNNPHNHSRYIFEAIWLDEDRIKMLYPKIKDEILRFGDGFLDEYGDFIRGGSGAHGPGYDYGRGGKGQSYGSPSLLSRDSSIPGGEKQFMLRRCYWRKFSTQAFVVNEETGSIFNLGSQVEKAKSIADKMPSVTTVVRVLPKLHMGEYFGDIEVKYEEDPFNGLAEFPYFRFSPYWVDGKSMGEIDSLKDPQREMNKRRSQLLHHLNSSANSGWWIEENSMPAGEQDRLESEGSKSGFVGVYKKDHTKPEAIQPMNLSEGHLKMYALDRDSFQDLTGMNDAVFGVLRGSKESGEALKTRRDQGLTVKEVAFDNYSQTQFGFYHHLIDRIRRPDKEGRYVYTEEEIQMLVEENDLNVDIPSLRDLGTGRYGLKITKNPTHETFRRQNFLELMDIVSTVPAAAEEIDLVDILQSSDLVKKEEIINNIQARRQQQAQLEAATMGQQLSGVG